MWLLQLHFSISILCLITFYGFRSVFYDQIKANGYLNGVKKGWLKSLWLFFVPILNVLMVFMELIMITYSKDTLDKFVDSHKRKND